MLAIDFVYSDGTTTTLNGGGSPGAFWVTSCALGPEETITTLELWASRPVGEAPTLPDTSLFGGLQWRTSTGGDCIVGTRTPGPGGLPQLQSMPVGGGVLAGAAGAWAEAGESGTLLGMLRLAFFAPVEAVTVSEWQEGIINRVLLWGGAFNRDGAVGGQAGACRGSLARQADGLMGGAGCGRDVR